MSNEKKIDVFIDSVGRTIVGNILNKKASYTEVGNPAIVNIEVRQDTGQIAVQLVPYIFREFVAADERDDELVWKFNNDNIVTCSNLVVDQALIKQYENVYKPSQPAPAAESEDIKVFDDSE
jgi:hypothetical protein